MKRNTFIASIVMLIVGVIGWIYGSNASYVDANGMVHDSGWLPFGSLLIILGILLLAIVGIGALIGYIRNR